MNPSERSEESRKARERVPAACIRCEGEVSLPESDEVVRAMRDPEDRTVYWVERRCQACTACGCLRVRVTMPEQSE